MRELQVYCQMSGGKVLGTVFHDQNRNGVYEPHLGEQPFQPRRNGDTLQIALVDCSPNDSYTCDNAPYAIDPMYSDSRRFTVFPSSGSISYSFKCDDCYGKYKLQLAQPVYWSDFYDDDMYDGVPYSTPLHDEDWRTSPVTIGTTREGSDSGTINPNLEGTIMNNFLENGETKCFDMSSDMDILTPNVQVIDWGIYFASDDIHQNTIGASNGVLSEGNITRLPTVPPSGLRTVSPSVLPTVTPTTFPALPTTTNPTTSPTGLHTIFLTEKPAISSNTTPTSLPSVRSSQTAGPAVSPTVMPSPTKVKPEKPSAVKYREKKLRRRRRRRRQRRKKREQMQNWLQNKNS